MKWKQIRPDWHQAVGKGLIFALTQDAGKLWRWDAMVNLNTMGNYFFKVESVRARPFEMAKQDAENFLRLYVGIIK